MKTIIAQFKFTPAKKSVRVRLSCRPLRSGESLPPALVSPTHKTIVFIVCLTHYWFAPQMEAGVTSFLRVEVTDSGAGIAIENQDKVFKEFVQFDRNKLQGGGERG